MNCEMCGTPAICLAHFIWLCPKCGNTADSSIQEGDVLMGKATIGTFLFDPGALSEPDRAILAQCWPVWLADSRQSYNPVPVNSLLEAGVPVDIEGPPETWRKLFDLFPSAVGRFNRR